MRKANTTQGNLEQATVIVENTTVLLLPIILLTVRPCADIYEHYCAHMGKSTYIYEHYHANVGENKVGTKYLSDNRADTGK